MHSFSLSNSTDTGALLCLNRNIKNITLRKLIRNARSSETMGGFIILTERGIHLRTDISQSMCFPTHPIFPNINLNMTSNHGKYVANRLLFVHRKSIMLTGNNVAFLCPLSICYSNIYTPDVSNLSHKNYMDLSVSH